MLSYSLSKQLYFVSVLKPISGRELKFLIMDGKHVISYKRVSFICKGMN